MKETKIQQLIALDKSVTKSATLITIILGVIGVLIFGLGMSCVTVWDNYFVVGIVIGIIGLSICGGTFPLFTKLVAHNREKITPQILQLMEEIEKS